MALAQKLPRDVRSEIGKVVSPAMGGVIIGHEMGRALGKEAIFVERPTGTFEFRRGFHLDKGDKVLLVEDVVTTGLSSREAIAAVKKAGGKVIAAAALVDRSAGEADLGVPFFPLVSLSFPTYAEDELPPAPPATTSVPTTILPQSGSLSQRSRAQRHTARTRSSSQSITRAATRDSAASNPPPMKMKGNPGPGITQSTTPITTAAMPSARRQTRPLDPRPPAPCFSCS